VLLFNRHIADTGRGALSVEASAARGRRAVAELVEAVLARSVYAARAPRLRLGLGWTWPCSTRCSARSAAVPPCPALTVLDPDSERFAFAPPCCLYLNRWNTVPNSHGLRSLCACPCVGVGSRRLAAGFSERIKHSSFGPTRLQF